MSKIVVPHTTIDPVFKSLFVEIIQSLNEFRKISTNSQETTIIEEIKEHYTSLVKAHSI